ncbi:MAG: MFS transporter [Candidatus Latescibacteria bacterium]|nr:MFS transporter [Candidatus Latescibacterota bacterium]
MNNSKSFSPEADDKPSWRITLTVISIAQFLSGVGFSFVLPFYPFYFRYLGATSDKEVYMWVGGSSLAFGLTMFFSAPVWGMISDRYGRKIMVLRSMFAGSIILGLMGLAQNPWHLLFLRVIQGMTTGTVTASVTLVSSITPASNRGFSLGILQTSLMIGASAGPFFGGFLADKYGFRIPCAIASILLFSSVILVIFGASERFVAPRRTWGAGIKTIREIIIKPGFPMIMAIYFMTYTLGTILVPILPFFIEKLSGDPSKSSTLTGVFLGMVGFISAFSAAMFGKIGDRVGHTKTLLVSLLLTGLFCFPQALAPNLWVLFIGRCLMGFGAGGIVPSISAMVSKIIQQEKVGSAYGLTSSATTLGIGIGPFFGGIMASFLGLRWPFVILGGIILSTAIIVQRMMYHHRFGLVHTENTD